MRGSIKQTEVKEDNSGDGALNGESSIGLEGADLLLGLLRGGDYDRSVYCSVTRSVCNLHPPNILYVD
jgi:hypothetical protein